MPDRHFDEYGAHAPGQVAVRHNLSSSDSLVELSLDGFAALLDMVQELILIQFEQGLVPVDVAGQFVQLHEERQLAPKKVHQILRLHGEYGLAVGHEPHGCASMPGSRRM